VVAKNDHAHRHLSEQFRAHSTDRLYVCLCFGGDLFPREGRIESDIGRDPHHRIKMASVSGGGKHAVTYYRQVESYGSVVMVECSLETGRTHQIRVHLSEKGHPLVADPVYGGTRSRWFPREAELRALVEEERGQMLHAATLGFIHPTSDDYVKFRCPPPERMMGLIRGLRQATELDPEAAGPWDREDSESFGR
jgi:23S rRNA pseudouridine1911/1915/1917 synthase